MFSTEKKNRKVFGLIFTAFLLATRYATYWSSEFQSIQDFPRGGGVFDIFLGGEEQRGPSYPDPV